MRKKRDIVTEKPEPQRAEQSKYIENWIARQPNNLLRRKFANGSLSYPDAAKLMATAALDDLLGPAFEGHICEVCSRDRFVSGQGCDEWETLHLPPDLYPAWHALKAKLPEGTEWTFCEVFPCLIKRLEKPSDPHDEVNKLAYFAKLTVPVGPFRFERNTLLTRAQ